MITGFLNIDKPPGLTSHDVVDAVRRVAGQRQVGHTGTLDPFATGVMVLVLGKATRLANRVSRTDKLYRGEIVLGKVTATYDREGEVTETGAVDHLDASGIQAAMGLLRGTVQQIPPPYSAKKVSGKRLYEYARAGERVEVEPKTVTVHEFTLLRWDPPVVQFETRVSAGTYARSLAHDLGRALGCGGHLGGLQRAQVGHFRIEDAVDLESLKENPALLRDRLVLIRHALPEIPTITLRPEGVRRLLNGSSVAVAARAAGLAAVSADELFALDESERLLALVERVPSSQGTLLVQPRVQLTERPSG
jgi:tRNA pseudouridine55 synthase